MWRVLTLLPCLAACAEELTEADFVTQYAQGYCEIAMTCGDEGLWEGDDCVAGTRAYLEPSMTAAASGGDCEFVPINAEGCLDVLVRTECSTITAIGACADVWFGADCPYLL